VFEEMDLDAILERRPDLVIVDELAHSNVPGSRNAKRYLDVQELIEAGIDVFTTMMSSTSKVSMRSSPRLHGPWYARPSPTVCLIWPTRSRSST
jgi:hypothetical protein